MELSRQKLNPYWPLVPAGGLLFFCGWLLFGSSGQLPFTAKLLERRLEALGMTRQTAISVLNRKGKGILIIKLRGTRFALERV